MIKRSSKLKMLSCSTVLVWQSAAQERNSTVQCGSMHVKGSKHNGGAS